MVYFDIRDLFKSNRLAFNLQRIWIQFIGLSAGYIGYLVLTYVSLVISGKKITDVWNEMGLFPCLARIDGNWMSWIIFLLGVLLLMACYLITSTAVSRAAYMVLKGNSFYTWREAFKYSFRKVGSILFSPLSLIILIVLFLTGAFFIGLLGKIPYLGELGVSLFYLLWLLAGLLVVFFFIILAVTVILTPSIIATTDDDTFDTVFQSFAIFWNQPWRFILYQSFILLLSVIGTLVLAFLVKRAFIISDMIFATVMGDKYMNLMGQGMYFLNEWLSSLTGWINGMFEGNANLFFFGREFLELKLPVILNISSYLFAIMMLITGTLVVSYGLAVFNVGTMLSYLILRRKKDGENLLERVDKEEEEESKEEAADEKEAGSADILKASVD